MYALDYSQDQEQNKEYCTTHPCKINNDKSYYDEGYKCNLSLFNLIKMKIKAK